MENIEKRISDLEYRVAKLENSSIGTVQPENSIMKPAVRLSINEFIKGKKLEDDVKRTLGIAYWLDSFEKIDFFSVSDIENTFRMARFKVPKNINDKINMNIRNGHMADHKERKDGKKAWYVTNTGAEFVENELNK